MAFFEVPLSGSLSRKQGDLPRERPRRCPQVSESLQPSQPTCKMAMFGSRLNGIGSVRALTPRAVQKTMQGGPHEEQVHSLGFAGRLYRTLRDGVRTSWECGIR